MSAVEIPRAAIALVLGLLLGSVLPADLFARRRGVDIRSSGDGNPGTINAFRVLGPIPGLVTAVYDLGVGVLAIALADLLGTPDWIAYSAGLMTLVGHRFPAFLGFRGGGQGMAAAAGMLVYGAAVALSRGWLSAVDIGGLAAIAMITFVWRRSDRPIAIVLLPVLIVRLYFAAPGLPYLVFMSALAARIWTVQLLEIRRGLPVRRAKPARGSARD